MREHASLAAHTDDCEIASERSGNRVRYSETLEVRIVNMRCLVVIMTVAACAGAAAAAATSCARAEAFLARHNASADESHEPGPICGGHCCGRGRELRLRTSLRRAAEHLTAKSTRRTADLLLSTRRTLQQHLTGLSHQSQNKTAGFFTQLFQGHATRTQAPLAALYDDIRVVLHSGSDRDLHSIAIESIPPRDLLDSARKFFRSIFPLAYHNLMKMEAKQFTPEYEVCLKDAYDAVQPFGDVPQHLGNSLSKSLKAARVLLEMLAVGAGALATTEHVLSNVNEECSNKLLKSAGCAVCGGHEARPCRNYCLNIARGCIGSLLSQLDGPWAGYVEGVERLTRVDADVALRELEAKVQEAIMYSFENRLVLENKVRHECGPPSTIDVVDTTTAGSTVRREDLRAPPPATELLQFAATLASTKKLFSTLADKVCDEPDFADEGSEKCWNGEKIGDYTKPLVTSISHSEQRYNPEISDTLPQDARVTSIAERLQQARTQLIAHASVGDAQPEAFMQGDEAGEEGSGSGRNYSDDDAAYDAEGSGEEGSGSHEIGSKTYANEDVLYSSTPKTAGAATSRPLMAVILAATAVSILSLT